MLHEIWCECHWEGWGISGPPWDNELVLEAEVEAETFKDACIAYAKANPEWGKDFDEESLTHWGLKLFASKAEFDARWEEERKLGVPSVKELNKLYACSGCTNCCNE